jgi:putative transposase
MNAFCERLIGSVRRECVDQLLILGERHLQTMIKEYVAYYNNSRPHQGIRQAIPAMLRMPETETPTTTTPPEADGKVIAFPVLGGLHHDYRRAA